MIFSVYNYDTKRYDYFEAPGTRADYDGRGTKYRPLSQKPQGPSPGLSGPGAGIGLVGFAPEALGFPLPQNAHRVGSGELAKGCVACRNYDPSMVRGALQGISPNRAQDRRAVRLLSGLEGFGETVPVPPQTEQIEVVSPSFGRVIAASCIAAIVGVLVQRALSD